MALAGDARAADPVCRHSPHRGLVDRLLAEADDRPLETTDFTYRR
jgi:pyrroloquinoline quinone biosynthesis protein E